MWVAEGVKERAGEGVDGSVMRKGGVKVGKVRNGYRVEK